MHLLTAILAGVVFTGHCIVIFWPRKPIKGPKDANGFPRVWSNNTPKQKDIASVWPRGTRDGE